MKASRIHFIGVCGTAMGSVAAAMKARGYTVTGSDEGVYPPMSEFLESSGVEVTEGFDERNVPANAEVIVIGNAMKRGNPEVETVLNRKLRYLSLPEALKTYFLHGRHNMVVTGTHGKTTASALLAHTLRTGGLDPGFMIGGIAENLGRGAYLSDSKYYVIEGDEYDTAFFDKRSKFLHYLPELVIINNIEFDHADIFPDLEAIMTSFRHLLRIVPGEGVVLANADDPNCAKLAEDCPAPFLEVGFSENAAHVIRDAAYGPDGSVFTLFDRTFRIPQVGEFNVRNAAMAAVAASFYGVEDEAIAEALATFQGVKRRQQIRGVAGGVTVIDDFGHHPTAIRQTITATRHRFPGARIWAVFEPRSNSTRRNVFQESLPGALGCADGVLLTRVARLDQIPPEQRLDPVRLQGDLEKLGTESYFEEDASAVIARLVPLLRPEDVVVIFSNGGFDNIHERLLEALR